MRKVPRISLASIVSLIIITILSFTGTQSYQDKYQFPRNNVQATNGLYPVVKVVDGDTIKVLISGKAETIRLIGINSPEVNDPRKPVECFGQEASKKAKSLLTGRSVQLVSDPTQGNRDKYGRLLRYVFTDKGINFDKWMIEEGYAYEYTYNLPYKYQNEFKQAQLDAHQNQKGLWAPGVCNTQ